MTKPNTVLTDEEIEAVWPSPEGTNSIKALARAIEQAILAKQAAQVEPPKGWKLVPVDLIKRAADAINWHLEPESPDEYEETWKELLSMLSASPTTEAQVEPVGYVNPADIISCLNNRRDGNPHDVHTWSEQKNSFRTVAIYTTPPASSALVEAADYESAKECAVLLATLLREQSENVFALRSALGAMLTQFGMDEDEWNKPTFNQARAAVEAEKKGQV